jgi:precorrin-2 dehydrogenase/sirohydrochlorin ferrochelatase
MAYYPIFLDLLGKRCLVVGGGEIATRKVHGMLKAGAAVTVVSPEVSESLQRLINSGRLRHRRRTYQAGDLHGCFLAYGATGVAEVDAAMATEAQQAGVLFNAVDRPALCAFITPALVERGDLTIAISTHGKCPGFAKKVRQKIEAIFGAEFGAALEAAAAWRKTLLVSDAALPEEARRRRQEQMLSRTWPVTREP